MAKKKAQEVLLENNGKLSVDPFEKPFGFCGKEFTDRSQIGEIKEKYRSNIKQTIIVLSIVSVLSFIVLGLNLFFEFSADRVAIYPTVLLMEFTVILLISMITYKKILSGFFNIIKFEMKSSSIYSFVTILYGFFSILSMAVYFVSFSRVDPNSLVLFGFCVSLYATLALLADLLTCIKEYNGFKIIESNEIIYTAEKHSTFSSLSHKKKYKSEDDHIYKIRKTSLVSGYFKKIAQRDHSNTRHIYLLGVIPILSLVLGSICFIFGRSPVSAVSITMLTALLSIPFGNICANVFVEFVASRRLKNKNVAFIGSDSIAEMSKAQILVFDDKDTVEITSFTEIQPGKRVEVKKYVDIAHRLFKLLDGTLSGVAVNEDSQIADGDCSIVINEISDNGIDIYYDASMNILMGDRRYMLAHGIKVKTDGSLSTATRGVDRAVLYIAFGGEPKLGFIINSKIKSDFIKIADTLAKDGIRVFVETYEPHINELYYELNKGDHQASIGVVKPDAFDEAGSISLCNGSIISGNGSIDLASAVNTSKEIYKSIKLNSIISILLSLGGFAASCFFAMLVVLGGNVALFGFLGSHMTSLLILVMVAGLIPYVVEIINLSKKSKTKK